jgi:hypothetical protein
VSAAVLVVALALTYIPSKNWRDVYCQLAGNDLYTTLAVFFGFVFVVVGYVFSLAIGSLSGSAVFREQWIFAVALLMLVLVLPLSNYSVYRHRMNGEADRALLRLFKDLIAEGIRGTHSFAECRSCGRLNTLILGQSRPCESCGALVDSSMNVRTVDV